VGAGPFTSPPDTNTSRHRHYHLLAHERPPSAHLTARQHTPARAREGKRRRAERGHLPGMANPLFGYRFLDDEPKGHTTYVIDKETGPIVQRIFQLALAGHSMRAIARLLNSEGVPTPSMFNVARGLIGRRAVGPDWRVEQVRRIIIDRAYAGEGVAYRWTRVSSRNGGRKSLVMRPVDDPKRLPLKVPPLVDLDTWNAAQQAVQARETTGRPPLDKDATWLRLHVYCGVCGKRMNVRRASHGNTYEYECKNRPSSNMTGKPCEGGDFSIRAHLLDPYAYKRLAGMAGLPEPYPLRELMVKRLGTDKTQALASMAEGYAAQIADKRADLETAKRRSLQTRDEDLAQQYMRDAETLNAEIHSLEQEYADARDELEEFTAGNAWIDTHWRAYVQPCPMTTLSRLKRTSRHYRTKTGATCWP
jgi:hypothetical protein